MSPTRYDEDSECLVPCPFCKQEIYDDADRCPRCGNWITEEDFAADRAGGRKPWWLIVGVLLCLYAVWRMVVG